MLIRIRTHICNYIHTCTNACNVWMCTNERERHTKTSYMSRPRCEPHPFCIGCEPTQGFHICLLYQHRQRGGWVANYHACISSTIADFLRLRLRTQVERSRVSCGDYRRPSKSRRQEDVIARLKGNPGWSHAAAQLHRSKHSW